MHSAHCTAAAAAFELPGCLPEFLSSWVFTLKKPIYLNVVKPIKVTQLFCLFSPKLHVQFYRHFAVIMEIHIQRALVIDWFCVYDVNWSHVAHVWNADVLLHLYVKMVSYNTSTTSSNSTASLYIILPLPVFLPRFQPGRNARWSKVTRIISTEYAMEPYGVARLRSMISEPYAL